MRRILIILVACLAVSCIDAKSHGKGGCRGGKRGRHHPHGKHGTKGHIKRDDEHQRDAGKKDSWDAEKKKAWEDKEKKYTAREQYAKEELMKEEDEWEKEGYDGPTSQGATKLLVDCLAAAGQDDVKASECRTEYEWVNECLECEEEKLPEWMIAAISVSASLVAVIVLLLVAYVLHVRRVARKRARETEFEPGQKLGAHAGVQPGHTKV